MVGGDVQIADNAEMVTKNHLSVGMERGWPVIPWPRLTYNFRF